MSQGLSSRGTRSCSRRRPAWWIAAVALAPMISAVADDDMGRRCRAHPGVALVTVSVRVLTKQPTAGDDLTSDAFRVTLGGAPREICAFEHSRQPVSLGILFDASGSMKESGTNLLAIGRLALSRVLEDARPGDEFFLEYIRTAPKMAISWTSDTDRLRASLAETPAIGRTALIDSMYLALNAMRKARWRNRALLVLTDGFDTDSVYSFREFEQAFAASPVPVFLALMIDRSPLRAELPLEEHAHREELTRFANRSGGYTTRIGSKQEEAALIPQLAKAIRTPYLMSFQAPTAETGGRLDLKVETPGLPRSTVALYRGALVERPRQPGSRPVH